MTANKQLQRTVQTASRLTASPMSASARLNTHWRLALAVALFVFASFGGAADRQAVPRLDGRVTDVANMSSGPDRERLSGLLARYERETFHQIGVLLIPTLSGETIETYSLRVANSWKLGQKGLDNGILVTMAMKERAIRIELGVGFERFIRTPRHRPLSEMQWFLPFAEETMPADSTPVWRGS
jgi:uncharacterized membrane protein YgcG